MVHDFYMELNLSFFFREASVFSDEDIWPDAALLVHANSEKYS